MEKNYDYQFGRNAYFYQYFHDVLSYLIFLTYKLSRALELSRAIVKSILNEIITKKIIFIIKKTKIKPQHDTWIHITIGKKF